MSKELDKVNEIYKTKAIYKADGTTVVESGWFNLLVTYAKEALHRLESIDNSNPSEALKCLEKIIDNLDDYADFEIKQEANEYIDTIKQALLKAQEPKQYLKWEDLEFKAENSKQNMAVLLNGTKYTLVVGCNVHFDKLAILRNGGINYYFLEADKQFFNDLHLERVEE